MLEGLSARPLYLRRGKYFEVLRAIWEKTGATPSSTLVCGDLYELDLAMPALLGAHVQLVMREDTPEYERNALAALGDRARAGPALSELLQRL